MATDLGMGQPLATALSACVVAVRAARCAGLPELLLPVHQLLAEEFAQSSRVVEIDARL